MLLEQCMEVFQEVFVGRLKCEHFILKTCVRVSSLFDFEANKKRIKFFSKN